MSIPEDVHLSQRLLQIESVSGSDGPRLCHDLLQAELEPLGFEVYRLPLHDGGSYAVDNLVATLSGGGPNLCFAGHTDVVPPGEGWSVDPFGGVIQDGYLYGRGAVDMKSSIASFVIAVKQLMASDATRPGRVTLLITGDEEKEAINGTRPVLRWMQEHSLIPDACLVGEPTSNKAFGDEIKIGRRGSLSATLTFKGQQGHVAYPHNADNPIPRLFGVLTELNNRTLDSGDEHFDASNLEVVSLSVDNEARNVIPGSASATLNIRFNPHHTNESLRHWITETANQSGGNVDIQFFGDGDAFINPTPEFAGLLAKQLQAMTGQSPVWSTGGGTSDARFIKDYCPVIEFGPLNETAHRKDERIALADLAALTSAYKGFLKSFFE